MTIIDKYANTYYILYCFISATVRTLGALGVDVKDLIRHLGRRIATATGHKVPTAKSQCCILRGNAAAVLRTVGLKVSKLDAKFYL